MKAGPPNTATAVRAVPVAAGCPGRRVEGGRGAGDGQQGVDVAVPLDQRAEAGDGGQGLGAALGRGHEPEVARGRLHAGVAAQHAEDGGEPVERLAQQLLVPVAADPVEHHAGERDAVAVGGEAVHERGHRARLRGGVDDEHHGSTQQPGDVRGRARWSSRRARRRGPSRPRRRRRRSPARRAGTAARRGRRRRARGRGCGRGGRWRARGSRGRCSRGPTLCGDTCSPRAASAAISPVATVVLPAPDDGAATTSRGALTTRCLADPSGPRPSGA